MEAVAAVTDAASTVVNTVSQIAGSKEALSWLYGEDEQEEDEGDEAGVLAPIQPVVPVPLATLQPWGSYWESMGADPDFLHFQGGGASSSACIESDLQRPRTPPWELDNGINAKIHLWYGDLCALEVDALLAPTATSFRCGASTVFERVLRHGGKDLRSDLHFVESCRSGEARITKAYGLPCCRLLLTVGPRYKDKYQEAAQNTLNACYRECFQLLVESDLRTIAIPCTWYTKGFPPEEQVHVALRTVRRCLEKLRTSVDAVVFVASSAAEAESYAKLLPLFFPRSAAEVDAAAAVLPACCWDPWGEVAVEERRIRVSGALRGPAGTEDDDDHRAPLFSPADDEDRDFLVCRQDADEQARKRLQGTMTEAETLDNARAACLRYIRWSKEMQPESEGRRFLYRTCQDRFGRHGVVLLGTRLPALGIRDDRTLPLFVKELEHLKGEKFVLIYVHSGVDAMDSSKLEVLQEMLAVISARYRAELAQLLVLHPGYWFRAAFAVGTTVCDATARAWRETVYVEAVADLAAYFDITKLELPEYVRAFETS